MKTSRKMSLASIAAIGLPVVGIAGATAQAINPAGPEASVSITGGDELVLRSDSTDLNVRSNGNISQIATTSATGAVAVEGAGIDPMRGWAESDFDAYAAYWEAGYNYNQLLTLAEEWNLSEFEAKARAGDAILAGDTSSFDDIVAGIDPFPAELETYDEAAPGPAYAFWEAGFSYEDALALSEAWNVDSWDAKVMASEMIAAGDQDDVEALLSV